MDRKREDWLDVLREAAVSDSSEKLPEGLWQRISSTLAETPPVTPPAARKGRLWVWAGSAAAAAAVIALGLFTLRTSVDGLDGVTGLPYVVSENPSALPDTDAHSATTAAFAEEPARGEILADNTIPRQRKQTPVTAKVALTPQPAGENPDAQAAAGITDVNETDDVPAQNSEQTAQTPEQPDGHSAGNPAAGRLPQAGVMPAAGRKAQRGRVQMSLSATGVASMSNGSVPAPAPLRRAVKDVVHTPMLVPNQSGMLEMDTSADEMYANNTTLVSNSVGLMEMNARSQQYSYRHRQPLTFALNVDVNVGHNLFVGAGVSYSMLSSTATSNVDHSEFKQSVHYVGIPVTLRWAFLDTRFVTLYAGLEGQAEFCVDARFGGEKADIETLQWSAHALAGAQFNIGKHIGIYAEPKLSHYFRDTALTTIRNTQGVNFNLQLGLRFSY